MPDRARELHDQWKMADSVARDSERQIKQEWDDYFSGKGAAPGEDLLRTAKGLRQYATERLNILVMYMEAAAK